MDDLPTPTEQHSKFALKMMLDNLTPEQRKAYETNGRFTVHLQGKTYLISRIADNPVPAYDLATIEKEIRSLSSISQLSNGFKQAMMETVARWRGELEARPAFDMSKLNVSPGKMGSGAVKPLTITPVQQAMIDKINQQLSTPLYPHPFAKRNKP